MVFAWNKEINWSAVSWMPGRRLSLLGREESLRPTKVRMRGPRGQAVGGSVLVVCLFVWREGGGTY
jgi:hypothetical protein